MIPVHFLPVLSVIMNVWCKSFTDSVFKFLFLCVFVSKRKKKSFVGKDNAHQIKSNKINGLLMLLEMLPAFPVGARSTHYNCS